MASFADLKRLGLALPGVEFFHLRDEPALRANGRMFAIWWEPDRSAVLKLDPAHQTMLFEVRPKIFSPHRFGARGLWSQIAIGKLSRDELKFLVTEAWMQVVPKKMRNAST